MKFCRINFASIRCKHDAPFEGGAEARPEAVALAKELRGQRMSLRKIAAELARRGYLTANGRQYVATAVQEMLAG